MITNHNLGEMVPIIGFVWLFIALHCGGVSCYKDSIFDYVSFHETGEWSKAYAQTCRGKSADGFREPRYLRYAENLRPPWESKTPVTIHTKDVIRKEHDNVTLHIYNNVGTRGTYSISYGFQRDKECIHGQDSDCIVEKTFGSVRALVVNADRFPEGQNLNFLKDHFLNEEPEKHVTILNGGSDNERKFYEAVFLGGYIPKALQTRGKSSHVIDGKSYPLEIYMYFVDETVPSLSLATILVVLVEESERENPFIKPIVSTVVNRLYKEERKFFHNSDALHRTQRQFHNQAPTFKYDIFAEHKKKSVEQIRQEMLAASANLEEDLTGHLEIFEKMQALESQLLFLDEDLKRANDGYKDEYALVEDFLNRDNSSTTPLPVDDDELYSIAYMVFQMSSYKYRKKAYDDFIGWREDDSTKEAEELMTYKEWTDVLYHGLLEQKETARLEWLQEDIRSVSDKKLKAAESQRLGLIHENQHKNLSFHVAFHSQKVFDWAARNRNVTYMKGISVVEKYRLIKEAQDLLKERGILNEDVYNHFFGNDSLHQRASLEWDIKNAVPNFANTRGSAEENKHKIVDSILISVNHYFKEIDYATFINETIKEITNLVEVNNFADEQTMRDVLHHHKFGFKDVNEREKRNYVHEAFFAQRLPTQEKRAAGKELGNMQMSTTVNMKTGNASPMKVIVDQVFQISWLIPPNGGYYYYSGSSPVPPCHRAQNVIVFKKPITMSRNQIEMLTRIPISFDKKWDIVHTTPVLHDTKFRVRMKSATAKDIRYEEITVPVYHQPRNHLFLGHDGVHKNAVEDHDKRVMTMKAKLAKEMEASCGTQAEQLLNIWSLMACFIYLIHLS